MSLKKKIKKSAKPRKKVLQKRPAVRKAARKKTAVKKAAPKLKVKVLGTVTHYFPKVRAAVIKLKTPLSIGNVIKIKGHTTDFSQAVNSMQINHVSVSTAKKGDEIGLLVDSRVRKKDMVYLA